MSTKTRMLGLPNDMISLTVSIHECKGESDRQTDRQTDSQQRRRLVPRLGIASRGRKCHVVSSNYF